MKTATDYLYVVDWEQIRKSSTVLDTVAAIIYEYILTNWKQYAYLDNPSCIILNGINSLLKKLESRRILKITGKPTPTILSALWDTVLKMFGWANYRITKTRNGKIIICQPEEQ